MYFYFQTVQLIDKTDADVKIFAGDVNALPFPGIINGKRQPYSLLTSILTDSLVDRYVLFLSFHISPFLLNGNLYVCVTPFPSCFSETLQKPLGLSPHLPTFVCPLFLSGPFGFVLNVV